MLIDPRMAAALKKRGALVTLCEIDHPDGLVNVWSGVGTLQWDGKSWTGAGMLASIEPVTRTTELRIDEIRLVLRGIEAGTLQDASTDIRNREATTWLAALDEMGKVAGTPLVMDEILLDYAEQEMAEDGTITLTLVGQTGFWMLERTTEAAWTPEEAVFRHGRDINGVPNETGFDFITQLKNKDTKWSL